ncbi:hypothetical protein [Aureibacter tunicatorum]|uniref:Peptidase M15A C-terminal domain-containing protein n=1 Tax=Aureibacter tunicatorum TaxID=866807 RepID=A0AAE3XSY8_9BACT|nr:hypothetical protein [Aureibacter tunicatorum]MDR6241454.1 hypothetical protein [Aureibacter tunicatorum]BDD06701.1 hypothetical protein AUTU_41840 [Aureibacter tunicatorum]
MRRIQVSKNFCLDELVSPRVHEKWGENALLLMDDKVLPMLEAIRKNLGGVPLTVNNWAYGGGTYQHSGFREPEYYKRNSDSLSLHRFGRAIDVKCSVIPAPELWRRIYEMETLLHSEFGLGGIENILKTTRDNKYGGWVHLDFRASDNVVIF